MQQARLLHGPGWGLIGGLDKGDDRYRSTPVFSSIGSLEAVD